MLWLKTLMPRKDSRVWLSCGCHSARAVTERRTTAANRIVGYLRIKADGQRLSRPRFLCCFAAFLSRCEAEFAGRKSAALWQRTQEGRGTPARALGEFPATAISARWE